ncbi:MAG: DedA family protein [Bdellovibrionota bacterium]|jgi:membrane protein DedA with SNARE-associated domain
MSLEQLLTTEGYLIYLLLFMFLMGGALGLPIPEDLPLIAAGVFAFREEANIFGLFATCYLGVVTGDIVIFVIGRRWGSALFSSPWFRRKLSPRRLKRFKQGLERNRFFTIFLARHLFYLRMVTFIACGAVKMSYARFILADAIAALVSVPLMMTIGYTTWEHQEHLIENIEWLLLALLLGVGFLLFRSQQSPKPKRRIGARRLKDGSIQEDLSKTAAQKEQDGDASASTSPAQPR